MKYQFLKYETDEIRNVQATVGITLDRKTCRVRFDGICVAEFCCQDNGPPQLVWLNPKHMGNWRECK